jgi:SAM-dependent methyltransferase
MLRPAAETYDACASFYDAFTAHHRYDRWTADLLALAEPHGLREPGQLLDVGCGTGKSLAPMLARGWSAVGCDISAGMLELCRANVSSAIELHQTDVLDLPVVGAFDLIWALDDVVNYLVDDNDLDQAFTALAANLAPGGLLLFDANTLASYRTSFAGTEVCEAEDLVMVWQGGIAADFGAADLASAQLDAFARSGKTWKRLTSVHTQRHHPEHAIRAALSSVGLRCLSVYGQFADGRAEHRLDESRHNKAIYIVTTALPCPQ